MSTPITSPSYHVATRPIAGLALLAMTVALASCGPDAPPAPEPAATPSPSAPEPAGTASPSAPEPAGTASPSASGPPRVAGLSPSLTRVLRELHLGARLVAAEAVSARMPDAPEVIEIEQLLASGSERPLRDTIDVAIGLRDAHALQLAEALREAGVHVVTIEVESANASLDAIARIGEIVGARDAAMSLASRWTRSISAVAVLRDGKPRTRVAWISRCDPLHVVGGAGLDHETIELAGAENVFHVTGEPQRAIGEPDLFAHAPERILHTADTRCDWTAIDAHGVARLELPASWSEPGLDLPERVGHLHELLYGARPPR